MKADEINLKNFINVNDTRFIIPVYQRNYDWKKSNCEKLFADIKNIIETGNPHFLGTIVYQFVEGECTDYIIIDGQQRITSIILLAKALSEIIDDPKYKKNITSAFIRHSNGWLENQLKLKPSEYDRAVFEKIMSDEPADFSDSEKFSALYANYDFFKQKISGSKIAAEEIYKALSKLNVVRIILNDENPQEIFESLNSTGLDLSKADLIRNYLLMSLDYESQEFLYKNYWLKVELLLKSSVVIEKFMLKYLITKRKSTSIMADKKKVKLSSKNLYEYFKTHFKDTYKDSTKSVNVENFLQDMYNYAKIYQRVTFSEDTNFNELSALEKKFYELTYMLDADNAPIILMYLYDKYVRKNFDEQTFIKFVDALISFVFRAKVCSSNGIDEQLAGNVIYRLDKHETLNEESFWDALNLSDGSYYVFPRDEEFKAALTNENLYSKLKPYVCKYLLYSLEKFNGVNSLPDFSKTAVEHIIPPNPNKKWSAYLNAQNDLQNAELVTQTLGNLVLTADNEKVEWEDFDVKKNRFINSKFFYTRDVAKLANVNSKQILARAKSCRSNLETA